MRMPSDPGRSRHLPVEAEVPGTAPQRVFDLPWPILIFLIGLAIPWVIPVGSLRLSVYRIVLIVMIVPCLLKIMRGEVGSIRIPDIAVALYCVWGAICLAVIHGPSIAFQSGGILFVETAGAYLLARCYIRNAKDFRNMAMLLFIIVAILLPFGIIELVTDQKPLSRIFGLILPTIETVPADRRWGLSRVQGPYEHPILFGVCCGGILALTHLVLGHDQPAMRRWFKSLLVISTAFLALSSGPLTALVAQILLLGWNWALAGWKARWKLLWTGVIAANIAVYLYSGESVARFYISHAPLFDSWSAYYRLLIWEYGSATVLNHPLFGIGFNEYERPEWMVPSVDMFWLNHGIMFGLPGAFLIGLAFLSTIGIIARQALLDSRLNDFKTGYLISMAGFFCVGWTVHFWNGTYALFLFLLASGLWLAQEHQAAVEGPQRRAPSRHVRAKRKQGSQTADCVG
jgi:hypothetical protein